MSLNETIDIPKETLESWQVLLDVMAEECVVPTALIMKAELPDIEVLLSSNSKGNPYKTGDSECLFGSGLYCERVITTKSELLVENALKDTEWDKNPDIELNMISYLGLPICWPNDEVFGTICLLDSKENKYKEEPRNILKKFQEYIEDYLSLRISVFVGNDKKELAAKEARCEESFTKIETILQQVYKS